MQQTQLVCPHCGSTLTFGVEVPAGTPVTCLICSQAFAAANPVAVSAASILNVASGGAAPTKPLPGVTAAMPKEPKLTIRKPKKVARGSNPAMLIFTVVLLCLLTGGVAFSVWKMTNSPRVSDSDARVANTNQDDDGKKEVGGTSKDPDENVGTLAGQDTWNPSLPPKLTPQQPDDINAKLQEEVASAGQLKRKNPPKSKDSDPDSPPAIDVKIPQKKVEPPPRVIGLPQERINAAIEKGVKLLKQGQSSNGSWPGDHSVGLAALGGLTLVECGVPVTDPAVRSAADFVRSNVANLVATYELSASILFLDRLGIPDDRAAIQAMALRLIAGQNEFGGWTYKSRMLTPPEMYQLHCFLRSRLPTNALGGIPLDATIEKQALGAKGVVPNFNPGLNDPPIARLDIDKGQIAPEKINSSLRFLSIVKNPSIEKGKIQQNFNGEGDNSNTQFALLALWAARRHGIPSDAPIMASYRRFVASQNPDGGWGYFMGGGSSNTMTNVGLLGLALGHGVAPDIIGPDPKDPKKQLTRPALQDRAIQRGLAFLARHIGQPVSNPTRAKFNIENMYFLWSIERVGVLYDLKTIGGKDWYGWGAQNLVSNQTDIGAWKSDRYPGSDSAHVNTCLALLFLRRSNLVHDLTNNLRFYSGIRDPG